jgi:hypothetical protein
MTPDDFGEGVLRIFPRELPQQIQIVCHSFESISPRTGEIRQINSHRDAEIKTKLFSGCLCDSVANEFVRNFTFNILSRNLTAQ